MEKDYNLLITEPFPARSSYLLKKAAGSIFIIESVSWEQVHKNVNDNRPCILAVNSRLNNEQRKILNQLRLNNKNCFIAVFNAPEKMTTSELLSYGNFRGFFPSNITQERLKESLPKLAHGHYLLPEETTEQLIQYYQSCIVRFGDPSICNLTFREKELLKHLRQGLSNNQLADKLFISEHTVKSHLYKIFKKIKVKNRSNAVAWAYKYLA